MSSARVLLTTQMQQQSTLPHLAILCIKLSTSRDLQLYGSGAIGSCCIMEGCPTLHDDESQLTLDNRPL